MVIQARSWNENIWVYIFLHLFSLLKTSQSRILQMGEQGSQRYHGQSNGQRMRQRGYALKEILEVSIIHC